MKKDPMGIPASELAAILATWGVALIGCKNVISSKFNFSFPSYITDIVKPDSPMLGLSAPFQICFMVAAIVSVIGFTFYDSILSKIHHYSSRILLAKYGALLTVLILISTVATICYLDFAYFEKVIICITFMILILYIHF